MADADHSPVNAAPGGRDHRVGEVFAGRYRLDEVVDSGSEATVYRARDALLARDVAVRVIEDVEDDHALRYRFAREARAVQGVRHENLVEIRDVGSERGAVFLVMEFLEGERLDRRIARGPIPPSEAVEIMGQTAAALATLHDWEVLLQDLRPTKVMLCAGGVRLLGACTSRAGRRVPLRPFPSGEVPAYAAPEALTHGHHHYGSDLYSLGVVAFEMLAGRAPFTGAPLEIALGQIRDPPPDLSSLAPGVPTELAALVMALLEKQPERRPPSADAVLTELEGIARSL